MKSFKFLLGLMTTLLLVGCGPTSNPSEPTTSVDPNTTTSETPTETSNEPVEYVSLETAIANTRKSYSISVVGLSNTTLLEVYRQDLFISTVNRIGFAELDNDKSFAHQLAIELDTASDYVQYLIKMYGRVGPASVISMYQDRTFFPTVEESFSTFTKISDNVYESTDTGFAYSLKNLFQNSTLKYCNYFEFVVGENGGLKYLHCYEGTREDKYSVATFQFDILNSKSDVKLYKDWVDNGSVVNERLADYKSLYQKSPVYAPTSVYEGETVVIEGIVTTKDVDNNLYVGTFDPDYGYLGIKVENKGGSFEPQDSVKVTGTIKTKNQNVYLENANVVDLGKKGDYLPVYDEESLVDLYGGGTYAAQLFVNNPPIFSGSLYSTYAKIGSYEEKSLSEDTNIQIVFETYKNGNEYFSPNIIVPKNLSSDKKDEIYNFIKNVGKFGESTAEEISIEKVVVSFNPSSTYGVEFILTEDSVITKKLTAEEKIEKFVGLEDFPTISNKKTYAFTFGGFQGMILESYYGITDYEETVKGLFISYDEVDKLTYSGYINKLKNYGYTLVDEVYDIYHRRHSVYRYKNENSFLAITLVDTGAMGEEVSNIEMWVYNNDKVLLTKSPEETLSELSSDFWNMDYFTRAAGSYAADYEIFEIDTYAGKMFVDDPLVIVTIRTTESTASTYAKQLIKDLKYTQYRVNGTPYSYTTRGQSHYVLQTPDGVFVDLSCYHTSDYTYTGHDEWEYRIEMMIYKAEEPIKFKTYTDISVLSSIYAKDDPSLDYSVGLELPEDTKVEYWAKLGLKNISYGYTSRDEAFIYSSDLPTIWENLKESIKAAGYKAGVNTSTRASFSVYINGNGYYVSMLYEPEKGYIRLMNDILGAGFY